MKKLSLFLLILLLIGCGNKESTPTEATTNQPPKNQVVKSIKITSPVGGETFKTGTIMRISWESKNITEIDIYVMQSNGTKKLVKQNVVAAPQYYEWNIPSDLKYTDCKIWISDSSENNVFAETMNYFTVIVDYSGTWVRPGSPTTWFALSHTYRNSSSMSTITGAGQITNATGYIYAATISLSTPFFLPNSFNGTIVWLTYVWSTVANITNDDQMEVTFKHTRQVDTYPWVETTTNTMTLKRQ